MPASSDQAQAEAMKKLGAAIHGALLAVGNASLDAAVAIMHDAKNASHHHTGHPSLAHHTQGGLRNWHHGHNGSSGMLAHHRNGTLGEPLDDSEKLSAGAAVLLMYAVLFLMLGFQTGLLLWKQKHKRSYEMATLVGLWLMPALICVHFHFWRFIFVWVLFSAAFLHLLSLCLVKKLASGTPRKVYSYFMAVHRVTVFVGVSGYVLILCEFFGLGPLLHMLLPKDAAIDVLWYGLYFGILGRDCAEVAADRMASGLGQAGAHGGGARQQLVSTVNACGVCGNHLNDFSHLGEAPAGEEVVQLSCKHCFHDLCIRGWTLVGKKDMCPVCNEKVDLRTLFADRPWLTRNLTWIQMLDGVRYMVVWNPIIFSVLSVLFHLFAPHHHHHPPGLATGLAHAGGGLLALGGAALNGSHIGAPTTLHLALGHSTA